jgi:hypothetical protein
MEHLKLAWAQGRRSGGGENDWEVKGKREK